MASWNSFGQNLAQGSISGVASGLISGGLSGLWDRIWNGSPTEQLQRQFDFNRDLMNHQAKINMQLYDHQFKTEAGYNSPTAQMQRLEDAGLNPALVYGSGDAGGSVNAQLGPAGLSSLSAPRVNTSTLTNPFTASQIDLNEALAEQARANAKRTLGQEGRDVDKHPLQLRAEELAIKAKELQNLGQDIQNSINRVSLNIAEATQDSSIEFAKKSVQKLQSDINLLIEQANTEKYKQAQTEESTKLIQEQTMNAVVERSLQLVRIQAEKMGMNLTQAEVRESAVRAGVLTKQGKLLEQQALSEVLRQKGIEADVANTIKEGKWIHYKNAVGLVKDVTGVVCDVIAIGTGLGGFKSVVSSHGKVPTVYGSDNKPISWTSY